MGRVIRLGLFATAIYFYFKIAFPAGAGKAYDMVTVILLAGGAMGVAFLIKLLDFGESLIVWAIEGAFAVAVFFYLGFSLPQSKGVSPIVQLWHGHRPTQSDASDGLQKLGLNPNLAPAAYIVSLFPKR